MSISSIEGGQGRHPIQNSGPVTQRPDIAGLLLDDSSRIHLRSLSPQQLARLRQYQNEMLGHIQEVQGGCGLIFPPLPTDIDPLQILRKQDPEAYAAFARLKPEEQQVFLQLCRDIGLEPPVRHGGIRGGLLGGMRSMFPQALQGQEQMPKLFGMMSQPTRPSMPLPRLEPQINSDLLTLLKSGKLMSKDSQGRSLLQNLTDLSHQEMGPTLDRKQIFQQLCNQLANPGTIKQGTHGTCAPTTIQYLQATRDPAEYARIMVGLTSKEGKVRLRNGDELKRDLGSLAPDGNNARSTISRLYQAALMEYGNGESEYDNRTDEHTQADDTTYSGQRNEDSERILDAMFGEDYQSIPVDRGNEGARQQTERMLRQALDRGQQIPVALEWGLNEKGEPTYHMLLVVGMTENTVILRNPWGDFDANENNPARGPDREGLDFGGTVELSKEEFLRRCYNIIVPGTEPKRSSK